MKVAIILPQDAVPGENPYREAEMSGVPHVGDLIGHDRAKHMLIVTSVTWNVYEGMPFDIGHDPQVHCDWAYEEEK